MYGTRIDTCAVRTVFGERSHAQDRASAPRSGDIRRGSAGTAETDIDC